MCTALIRFLPLLLLIAAPALAQRPDSAPVLSEEPTIPEPLAPEAREILRKCRDPVFINCFKNWRPGMDQNQPMRPPPAPPSPNGSQSPAKAPGPGSPFGRLYDGKATDAQKAADEKKAGEDAAKGAAEDKAKEEKQKEKDKEKEKEKETKPSEPPPPPAPPATSEEDLQTYQALLHAIQTLGLENRLRLGEPPKDGSVILEVAPPKGGRTPATRPSSARPQGGYSPDER